MFFSFGTKKKNDRDAGCDGRPKRILLVDDDPEILAYSQKCLFRYFDNIIVLIAFNGHDALGKVESEKPDLVVLDVKMPGMDGHEAFAAIKEMELINPPKTLIISGFGDEIEQMAELGVDAVLPKPYSPAKLVESIESLLDIKAIQ